MIALQSIYKFSWITILFMMSIDHIKAAFGYDRYDIMKNLDSQFTLAPTAGSRYDEFGSTPDWFVSDTQGTWRMESNKKITYTGAEKIGMGLNWEDLFETTAATSSPA